MITDEAIKKIIKKTLPCLSDEAIDEVVLNIIRSEENVSLGYISKKEVLNTIWHEWFDEEKELSIFDLANKISYKVDIMKPITSLDIRKTGFGSRWVKVTDGINWWYECEHCHSHIAKGEFGNDYFSSFCPKCGEYMESIDDNERPYTTPIEMKDSTEYNSEVTIKYE